jgi:signal transduction histidine kinase
LLDVNEVIREVIALLHSKLQKHQITVQAELISKLPPVLADRIQLQQVVANLVATGMGLSICRSIIEAHNGPLSLLSASDRGSVLRFYCRLGT